MDKEMTVPESVAELWRPQAQQPFYKLWRCIALPAGAFPHEFICKDPHRFSGKIFSMNVREASATMALYVPLRSLSVTHSF